MRSQTPDDLIAALSKLLRPTKEYSATLPAEFPRGARRGIPCVHQPGVFTLPQASRMNPYALSSQPMSPMMRFEQDVRALPLDPKLLHLVRLRASQINGCAFCMEMHSREARDEGETQLRLDVLAGWRDTTLFSDRERAALGWTEDLTCLIDTHASDSAYAAVEAQFTHEEIAALTLAIIAINGWNRIAIGFRLPLPAENGEH